MLSTESGIVTDMILPQPEKGPSRRNPDAIFVTGIFSNSDGKMNIKDATTIQKHLAKIIALDDNSIKLSDFNNDSKVDVKDATAIQKHLAGITSR